MFNIDRSVIKIISNNFNYKSILNAVLHLYLQMVHGKKLLNYWDLSLDTKTRNAKSRKREKAKTRKGENAKRRKRQNAKTPHCKKILSVNALKACMQINMYWKVFYNILEVKHVL